MSANKKLKQIIPDEDKTKEELIKELNDARLKITEIDSLRDECRRVESVMRNAVIMAKDEKARSEAIISSIGDGISVQDTKFRILIQNQSQKDLVGEHIGEFCYKAYQNRDSVCDDCHLVKAFEDGRVHKQIRSRLTDEGMKYVEITGSPLRDSTGTIIAGIETVRDITERKKIEQEAHKVEKLESVGMIAAEIAHEFNNLLTAISGNIALAKMYAKPETEMEEILLEAEKAAQRAEKLTNELSIFSKGGVLFKHAVSVSEVITDALDVMTQPNLTYDVSVSPGIAQVYADESQLIQALVNLLENSAEAMPAGGQITVRAEELTVSPEQFPGLQSGRYVRISVTDQGTGIKEKLVESIFEPFFTTKENRSGLGLTSASTIVHGHEGFITVDTSSGTGSTFHVYMPAHIEKAPPAGSEKRVSVGRKRILVMDDEEMVRTVADRMLNQCGCTTEFARNGEEMLEAYSLARDKGSPFDAVIIDLVINSGMGGREAVAKLLEIDPEAKAIVSSGYAEDRAMLHYKEYGFRGILPKPYRLGKLSQVLHDVIVG